MAHFYQRPTSVGTWANDQNVLTISVGSTAELILSGGGPPGQDKLVVAYVATMPCTVVVDVNAPLGPNERLIHLKPQQAGDIWVHAKLGSASGPDYATPVKVVAVPKKAVSIGPDHVILCNASDIQEAYNKISGSAPNATAYAMGSLIDFTNFLTKYRDSGRCINKLEANTHGSPGNIYFGSDWLDAAMIRRYQGQAFHKVFSPGAAVFFHGCNVAEGDQGNEFLVAFGETFLCGGGGSVVASTSKGVTHIFNQYGIGAGKVYHLWGDTKRVFVAPGGRIIEKMYF